MNENNKNDSISLGNKSVESLLVTISDLRTINRNTIRVIQCLGLVMFLFVGGVSYFFYRQCMSPHVRFISEGETKTLIGVLNAGRIQVNTDDRTGEMIIEVYHAKK